LKLTFTKILIFPYKLAILSIFFVCGTQPTIAASQSLLETISTSRNSDLITQNNQLDSDSKSDSHKQPKCVTKLSSPEEQTPETPGDSQLQPDKQLYKPDGQIYKPNKIITGKKIKITGYTIFRKEIAEITKDLEKQNSTILKTLYDAADKITKLYLEKEYITSRAVLVENTLKEDVIKIQVYEGSVNEIVVEGTKRINPEYICSRIRLAGLHPIHKQRLEDQLILLRSDPMFKNVEASLRPADENEPGVSTIIVRVSEASPFKAAFGVDNYSPPSIGSERLGAVVSYHNFVTSGDQISASYNRSIAGGLNLYDFNYKVPLNPMDGTLQLRASSNETRIVDPKYDRLNIRGNFKLYEINYRQPLVRKPRQEFALSLGFTYQDGQTFLFDNLPFPFGIGPDNNGVSRTSVVKFGQDYVSREKKGAWSGRSQFNFGTGLFNATTNNEPKPDSEFFSWYGQIQRTQKLSEDQLLILGLDLQLTPNSLLPSQQFVVGGAQTVRGYRQNTRSGDNGIRFSIEDQITIARDKGASSTLIINPFVDLGAIWNHPENPNNDSLARQRFLSSAGLGLLWKPIPNLNLRLDYGIPLVNLNDRGSNLQDSGLSFSMYYGL
jgi:hemolysin activation/secretion protein